MDLQSQYTVTFYNPSGYIAMQSKIQKRVIWVQ